MVYHLRILKYALLYTGNVKLIDVIAWTLCSKYIIIMCAGGLAV